MQINFVKLLRTAALTCCPREPSTKGGRGPGVCRTLSAVRAACCLLFSLFGQTHKNVIIKKLC